MSPQSEMGDRRTSGAVAARPRGGRVRRRRGPSAPPRLGLVRGARWCAARARGGGCACGGLAATPARGGRRAGAGRKRQAGRRSNVPHRTRARHYASHPVHVTLRARAGLPSLRSQRIYRMLNSVLLDQRKRRYAGAFQVVELTIQENHLHLIVEARGPEAHRRASVGGERARHRVRQAPQHDPPPARQGLGRPLARARAPLPARGPQCARLRLSQRRQARHAHDRRRRRRPHVVRAALLRLDPAAPTGRSTTAYAGPTRHPAPGSSARAGERAAAAPSTHARSNAERRDSSATASPRDLPRPEHAAWPRSPRVAGVLDSRVAVGGVHVGVRFAAAVRVRPPSASPPASPPRRRRRRPPARRRCRRASPPPAPRCSRPRPPAPPSRSPAAAGTPSTRSRSAPTVRHVAGHVEPAPEPFTTSTAVYALEAVAGRVVLLCRVHVRLGGEARRDASAEQRRAADRGGRADHRRGREEPEDDRKEEGRARHGQNVIAPDARKVRPF